MSKDTGDGGNAGGNPIDDGPRVRRQRNWPVRHAPGPWTNLGNSQIVDHNGHLLAVTSDKPERAPDERRANHAVLANADKLYKLLFELWDNEQVRLGVYRDDLNQLMSDIQRASQPMRKPPTYTDDANGK